MNLQLCLHRGGEKVTREDVDNVATPERTETHVPVPHGHFLDTALEALKVNNFQVRQQALALNKGGNQFFGLIEVEHPNLTTTDHGLVFGIRNSHDRTFPAGLVAGSQVFCCDNLGFSGEVKLSRKHTSRILRDLNSLVFTAVVKIQQRFGRQLQEFEAYKAHELTHERARFLMVEMVKRGVIGSTSLPKVLQEWENPSHDEFSGQNVWRLFNGVTEAAKEWTADTVLKRTEKLTVMMNNEVGMLSA